MAWHDNWWKGKICKNPEENVYCVGSHSLLSARLERNRDTEIEKKHSLTKIDKIPGYLPPCYWSCNAFSDTSCEIVHVHPFQRYKNKKIKETMKPYSVFTWPFRLSFNHSRAKKALYGSYPPDLEKRIKNFISKFNDKSIIFFYLNYDNPISGDEYKYALVGCSVLKKIEKTHDFPFSDEELEEIRSLPDMQHFPKINWAIQFVHDFENYGVILPYHKYLDEKEKDPTKQKLLNEMKVLIEEKSIVPSFKYVAADIDDDTCLYLLYKIKKSINIVQKHKLCDVSRQKRIIDELIQKCWEKRGLYPSLGTIIDIVSKIPENHESIGAKIISAIQKHENKKVDLLEFVFEKIFNEDAKIPEYLEDFNEQILKARKRMKIVFPRKVALLKKLSLFQLTRFQLENIIDLEPSSFKKELKPSMIANNPYLLCENYISEAPDLDEEIIRDFPIDFFKIDIGMFPDSRYLKRSGIKRNLELQNLIPESPERIRPLIVDYLYSLENRGDCYCSLEEVFNYILEYPLFYEEKLQIDKELLVDPEGEYYKHFQERLTIINNEDQFFFYLNEVKRSEELVQSVVVKLLGRDEHGVEFYNIDKIVQKEAKELKERIKDFDSVQFVKERTKLLSKVLKKSFYVISGKPGSGKTYVLRPIVERLHTLGEGVLLLAPTGKASLRLKQLTGDKDAQTIDLFLYKNGYGGYLENYEDILLDPPKKKFLLANLIIDESSMVDLQKLAVLFSVMEIEKIKRIIMVGDENQLPPIGFGRPYYDIIQFIKSKDEYRDENYIRLKTNCRQELDQTVLDLADVFALQNKYYEPLFEKISKEGQLSRGFHVSLWKNKEELLKKIDEKLSDIFSTENIPSGTNSERVNMLFGCYENGHVKKDAIWTLKLDRFQILSPYRTGIFGTLGLNGYIKCEYRSENPLDGLINPPSVFNHADKIIRINNWYRHERYGRGRTLFLANGSIGIINNKKKRYSTGRMFRYYFIDKDKPFNLRDDDENFELAYAITIHKSQGSDFKNVFLVIPRKQTLLSKELLYTALTRSTHRVYLFLEKSEDTNPLELAKKRSAILSRNTSIFMLPEDYKKIYEPEKNVFVKSKIEYIIYKALVKARDLGLLNFTYEQELSLSNRNYVIHPDFTIQVGDRTYYWEHLGELDLEDYYGKWQERKGDYSLNGYYENLITTDDLGGVKEEIIEALIKDIVNGTLKTSKPERFSKHHYQLYTS
jgi:hypothetical protein